MGNAADPSAMPNDSPTERLSTVPPPEVLRELTERWNQHPGIARMGIRLDLSTPGAVRADVDPIEPHHRGGMGTPAVNGPTIAGVFDLVTGLTGYLQAVGKRVGVAQLSIQFLRPVHGDRFHVIGRPTRAGRSLVFVAAELFDEAGVVCARSDGLVSLSNVEGSGELSL
jgi:acyl-coenzyme A thioesterase PaaI-like protein